MHKRITFFFFAALAAVPAGAEERIDVRGGHFSSDVKRSFFEEPPAPPPDPSIEEERRIKAREELNRETQDAAARINVTADAPTPDTFNVEAKPDVTVGKRY